MQIKQRAEPQEVFSIPNAIICRAHWKQVPNDCLPQQALTYPNLPLVTLTIANLPYLHLNYPKNLFPETGFNFYRTYDMQWHNIQMPPAKLDSSQRKQGNSTYVQSLTLLPTIFIVF